MSAFTLKQLFVSIFIVGRLSRLNVVLIIFLVFLFLVLVVVNYTGLIDLLLLSNLDFIVCIVHLQIILLLLFSLHHKGFWVKFHSMNSIFFIYNLSQLSLIEVNFFSVAFFREFARFYHLVSHYHGYFQLFWYKLFKVFKTIVFPVYFTLI